MHQMLLHQSSLRNQNDCIPIPKQGIFISTLVLQEGRLDGAREFREQGAERSQPE